MSFLAAAAIVGGGALVGGVISAVGAHQAAGQQAGAARTAQQIGQQQFQDIAAWEKPYMQAGYGAQNELNYLLGTPGTKASPGAQGTGKFGSLLKPFNVSDWKQLSPSYGFQLQQGQQGVLGQDATSQGALSGAAQKDLMSFNQGLASQSFGNAFNMYQTQQGNIFNRLASVAGLGQAAASQTGAQGANLAGQQMQAQMAQGAYGAAGTVGVANALSGGIQGAALPWLLKGGGGGAGIAAEEEAAAYSDRRLKRDIERVGTTDSGIPLYRFRYIDSPQVHIGVMADEVLPVIPEAVGMRDGYLTVDYGMI